MYDFVLSKHLLHAYTAFHTIYGFCDLSGLCISIRLLHFKRLVHMDASFACLQRLGDSFDVVMTVVLDVC